ncbi:MAG: hypothetical protein PHI71_05790 [Acidiphilium sp.]|nr:hypothetical protein [Acidiphilium sp.]
MIENALDLIHQPSPTYILCISSGLGALLLWGRTDKKKRASVGIGDIIKIFIKDPNSGFSQSLELVLFIAIGIFLSIYIAGVTNGSQAFAAGLGWTGLASKT